MRTAKDNLRRQVALTLPGVLIVAGILLPSLRAAIIGAAAYAILGIAYCASQWSEWSFERYIKRTNRK